MRSLIAPLALSPGGDDRGQYPVAHADRPHRHTLTVCPAKHPPTLLGVKRRVMSNLPDFPHRCWRWVLTTCAHGGIWRLRTVQSQPHRLIGSSLLVRAAGQSRMEGVRSLQVASIGIALQVPKLPVFMGLKCAYQCLWRAGSLPGAGSKCFWTKARVKLYQVSPMRKRFALA